MLSCTSLYPCCYKQCALLDVELMILSPVPQALMAASLSLRDLYSSSQLVMHFRQEDELLVLDARASARRSDLQHDHDRTTQALGEVIGELMAEARHHI